MKKRLKRLAVGVIMLTALALGGWMLTESMESMSEVSAIQSQVEMHDALVVRP